MTPSQGYAEETCSLGFSSSFRAKSSEDPESSLKATIALGSMFFTTEITEGTEKNLNFGKKCTSRRKVLSCAMTSLDAFHLLGTLSLSKGRVKQIDTKNRFRQDLHD